MKYVIPTLVLALVTLSVGGQPPAEIATPAVNGIWIGVGPDMTILPLGTYRFMFVPTDGTQPVDVTTFSTDSGNPTTPKPTPKPSGNLAEKTKAALVLVTDPDKATTANGLKTVYAEFVKSITQNKVTDPATLATTTNLITVVSTTGKDGWSEFASLVDSTLSDSTDIQTSKAALETFIAGLDQL